MRTIESPGVEIREVDLSFNTELPNGTTSLVVGYAKQGPTDELLNITTPEEFEQIYGTPENASERYMYHTAKQVLNANGTLLVTRLPYGSGDGSGYTTKYSALVYPYIPVDITTPCSYFSSSTSTVSSVTLDTITQASSGASYTSDPISFAVAASGGCVTAYSLSATVTILSGSTYIHKTYGLGSGAGGLSVDTLSTTTSAVGLSATITQTTLASSEIFANETSPANVYTIYLTPSGSTATSLTLISGSIFANTLTYKSTVSSVSVTPDEASHYILGEPVHVALDEGTYFNWLQGGINWKSTVTPSVTNLTNTTDATTILSNVGYGALIVVNEAKTTIDDNFAGYYVALADNTKMDKGSNYDSIAQIKSFTKDTEENDWVQLNAQSLAFTLTGSNFEHNGSISEIVESVPDFDFSNAGVDGYGDSIVLALFKVRPSIYNQEERVLDKVLYEAHIGSFDSTRKIQNPAGGAPSTFYLEDVVNTNSSNLKVFINPYISKHSGQWYDPQSQEPKKYVRVNCGKRSVLGSSSTDVISEVPAEPHNTVKVIFDGLNTNLGSPISVADNLYGVGEAIPCDPELEKSIGNLPRKLEKALRLAENYELVRIDLVPEGGLGTIWTGMNLDLNNWPTGTTSRANATRIKEVFDDTVYIDGIITAHTFDADSDGLLSQENGTSSEASDLYDSVASIFNQFCQYTRKDCLYIADPLRYVFVQGNGTVKVLDDTDLNFSQHIFWPLKNLYGNLNSSYACTYANWFKVNDTISDKFVWVPSSGFAANRMINTDTNFYPWYAPAGLTRGVLTGIADLGINPSQKQRDLLYKNGINAVAYWPGDGYVVWGQKTLQRKPSAFDRINVRRLFLWAEKAVQQVSRYFVFEQNTPFTRQRLKNAIDPILAFAKSNEGIYDYMIVCDDRNNTAEVIDRNELVVDLYIKPVRVAEFILINFIATRTGQRFEELE